MLHQIECMLNLVSSYSLWWDLVLFWRFAVLLLHDDVNRLNAGSFLCEAMVLFRLAEGKQQSFVGDSAVVGFGPVQQGAFFYAKLAGVGGDMILMMPVFGSGAGMVQNRCRCESVPELDVLAVNALSWTPG
ncbi:hypothetical protein Nepgr_006811 [Nepenthes gracilis]|uniref:Uncharacterized protein n=1 Tax=Nepenthes gracilis TaxID=150966 RepID=A0AAD3S687_NEPGR|nr:hypothetical protein Nepgr_006811 [Nepenthes gracilis]